MWIHLPASVCAPALPESTLVSDSQCAALARSATWRTKPRTPALWRRVCRTERLTTHLSGLTCERLPAARGVAAFIASLPVIRASRLASPAASAGAKTSGTSGRTSRASSAKSRPPSSSSKTSAITFDWAFQKSGESYDKWVTRLRRTSSARRKSAPRIYESGCSLLQYWGTPCVGTHGGNGQKIPTRAAFWPTPDASPKRGTTRRYTEGDTRTGKALKAEAHNWPTPHGMANVDASGKRAGGGGEFAKVATRWPSPVAADGRSGKAGEATLAKNSRPLREMALLFILSLQGRKTTKRGRDSSASTRVLNPRFVEHLMGLPLAWTDCERSATESYRLWLRSHSALFYLLILSAEENAHEAA